MKLFYLDRLVDVSGVSGTGLIAQGVVFEDGTCALRWLTEHRSTAFYESLAVLKKIHLHGDATVIRFFGSGLALALAHRKRLEPRGDVGRGKDVLPDVPPWPCASKGCGNMVFFGRLCDAHAPTSQKGREKQGTPAAGKSPKNRRRPLRKARK